MVDLSSILDRLDSSSMVIAAVVKGGRSPDYGLAVIAESEPWPCMRVRPRLTFGDQGPERAVHEVLLTW